jgi:hypothetical protein
MVLVEEVDLASVPEVEDGVIPRPYLTIPQVRVRFWEAHPVARERVETQEVLTEVEVEEVLVFSLMELREGEGLPAARSPILHRTRSTPVDLEEAEEGRCLIFMVEEMEDSAEVVALREKEKMPAAMATGALVDLEEVEELEMIPSQAGSQGGGDLVRESASSLVTMVPLSPAGREEEALGQGEPSL